MGQYHSIYNKTKKEYISPHAFNAGAKLLEFSGSYTFMSGLVLLLCNSNGRGGGDLNINYEYDSKTYKRLPLKGQAKEDEAALNAVAGRWAGDEIVVQGDYAEKGDPSFITDKMLEKYKKINDIVIRALEIDRYLKDEINGKGSSGVMKPDMILVGGK